MTLEEFERAWLAFVARWKRAGRHGPGRQEALIAKVLADGLPGAPQDAAPRKPPGESAQLRCHMAVLRASGMFDRHAYVKANPATRKKGNNPFEHYCRTGWRGLRNPSRDFDVWWYWSEYLDPRSDRVDPLLHYALVGRHQRHAPVQPVDVAAPMAAYPPGTRPRRVCLFAGYDPDGVVDDYVLAYLEELSRHAEVYYLADGYMDPAELAKLDGVAKGAWAMGHGAYDFGSYSKLAGELVGWDVIDGYDELLLVNDSGFLLRPLDDVFREMDSRACDWWGLQATRHDFDRDSNGGRPLPLAEAKASMIGERFMSDLDHLHVSSYFLAFRRKVLQDPGFRRRLDAVCPQDEKLLVIYKYEIGLSRYLLCRGFNVSTYVPDLYPFHPLYTEQYFELLAAGFPLLKRNFLSENSKDVPDLVHWHDRVRAIVPDAPLDVLDRNLWRVSPDDRLRRSFAILTGEDGDVEVRRPHGWWQVVDEDRATPTYDHWWAFPVDPGTELLSSDQRAVLEEVREDPTIRKIVLTRGRAVTVSGANLHVVPLRSHEGQEQVMRARNVFVAQTPRVSVSAPLSPRRHRFVHVSAAGRTSVPSLDVAEMDDDARQDAARCGLVVASSRLDALAVASALSPAPLENVVVTGAPRTDLLLMPESAMPTDVRVQVDALRGALHGRPGILLSVSGPVSDRAAGTFPAEDVRWLARWCTENGFVLVFQDPPTDRPRRLRSLVDGTAAVRVDRRHVYYPEVLYREMAAVVCDSPDVAVDLVAASRPCLTRLPSEGRLRGLLHDLDLVLPGYAAPDSRSFREAVPRLVASPDPGDLAEWSRRAELVHQHHDGRNAARLVSLVRGLDAGVRPWADLDAGAAAGAL